MLLRRASEIADVRAGRLSEAERALERDEDVDGRAAGDDESADDTWQQRHSQPEVAQLPTHTKLTGSHAVTHPGIQRTFADVDHKAARNWSCEE